MNLSPTLQATIHQKLSNHTSISAELNFASVSGGSINESYRIGFGNQTFFCKINSATIFPQLFEKEKNGLSLIEKQDIIKVPSVIDCFETEGKQVLLLEWIEEGIRTGSFWKRFGESLAALHKQSSAYYGLDEDNYMGSVAQSNRKHETWNSFYCQERLAPMVKQCFDKNLLTKKNLSAFEDLQQKLPTIFEIEKPSLLHGDLWSGNFMCSQSNDPVLIDPVVYYGHRSFDLGMTTLFGGFHPSFYEAYHYHFPLPSNYKEQWAVCNLYPLLIHLYLFGSSYRPQIEGTLKAFS